jgi:hypothetical protein
MSVVGSSGKIVKKVWKKVRKEKYGPSIHSELI